MYSCIPICERVVGFPAAILEKSKKGVEYERFETEIKKMTQILSYHVSTNRAGLSVCPPRPSGVGGSYTLHTHIDKNPLGGNSFSSKI
jgi:hypothetical protein